MGRKILIVAAHPDDEVLGCGGSIARFIKEGYEAYTLILGEGITSRDAGRDRKRREKELIWLKEQAHKANKQIGVKEVFFYDFPDNRFDEVALLSVVKAIEKINRQVGPEVIYTHHRNDLNIDHRITYDAVLTACRPFGSTAVKEIYSFEIKSSSEWGYPYRFNPNYFIDITHTIGKKLSALKYYRSELREYPHPRSVQGVKLNTAYWGMRVGVKYAEAFEAIRVIK